MTKKQQTDELRRIRTTILLAKADIISGELAKAMAQLNLATGMIDESIDTLNNQPKRTISEGHTDEN